MPERDYRCVRSKEVLRLHHEVHLSERRIADICLVGKGTVRRYLERAAARRAGLAAAGGTGRHATGAVVVPSTPSASGSGRCSCCGT